MQLCTINGIMKMFQPLDLIILTYDYKLSWVTHDLYINVGTSGVVL